MGQCTSLSKSANHIYISKLYRKNERIKKIIQCNYFISSLKIDKHFFNLNCLLRFTISGHSGVILCCKRKKAK